MAAPTVEEEDFTSLLSTHLEVPAVRLKQISSDNEQVKEILCKAKKRFEEQESKLQALRSDAVLLRRARVNAEQQFSQVEKHLVTCNIKLDAESKLSEKYKNELEQTASTLHEKESKLQELLAMKENASANYTRVSNLNSQLQAEKLELLAVVERKNQEIDRLNEEWKNMSSKLLSANSLKCEAQAKLNEIESQETHFKFREKRIEQEKALLQKQVDWLNGELKTKTEEVTNLRKEKSSQVLELQGQLDERNGEVAHLRDSTETLKRRNEELEAKINTHMEKLKDTRDHSTKLEEQYKLELASQTKLAKIYKESTEENEKKCKELLTAVEEIEKLLKEANESKTDVLSRVEEQENSHKNTVKELEEKIHKLETELENANDLLTAARQRGLAPMTESALSSLSPTAAATSSLLKSGMTLTQIYSQYVEVSDLLQQEKDENTRLKQYMEQILKEIEEKAPMLQQQRQDYEQALRSVDQLSRRLDTSLVESEDFRSQAEEAKKHSEHLRREVQRMRIANADLSQQVQMLLKECEEARGGIVTSDTSDVPMSSDEVSSSSQVISQHLVTFRSIEELQQQNQKLLGVIRELSEDKEKKENEGAAQIVIELKKQLESTVEEVQEMKEAKERQMQVVEAVVRQRDMYRVLLENKGQSPIPAGDPSVLLDTRTQSHTPSKAEKEAEETKVALKELQKTFEEYRSAKTKNEEALNEKLEKANSMNVELQGQNSKFSSQLEFEKERYAMLSSNAEGFKKEAAAVTEKSQKLTLAVHKLQISLDSVTQELASTREQLRKAEVSCETLQAEKSLLKETEVRLLQENKSLLEQQKGQNILLTNLQSLQNNLERSEFETRSKLEAQIEGLEREATLLRKKLESEESHHEKVVKNWEKRVDELRNQLQVEIKSHQGAREKMMAAQHELDTLKLQHSQASANLEATEKRVDELLKEPGISQQDLEKARREVEEKHAEKLQEIQLQLTESRNRASLLEEQLKKAKQHVDQFKAMSAANEEALKDLNTVSEEYKRSVEEKLARAEEESSKFKTQVEQLENNNRRLLEENKKLQNAITSQTKELSETLAQVRGELASALKNSKAANANELAAKLQLREQARLASDCQEKYERELMLHAKDVEALTAAKDEHQQLSNIVSDLEEKAKTSEHKLEEFQSTWQKLKDDQAKEMKKMESRCADLVDQNSILHEQVQKLTAEITEARKRPLEAIVIPTKSSEDLGEGKQEGEGKSVEELWEIIRFVRREKEIAETKCELSQQESIRFQQRCEFFEKQLEEAQVSLSEEKKQSELEVETSAQHAEILEKVEKLNELTEGNKVLTEEKNKLEQKVKSLETKFQKVESELQPLKESNRTVTAQKDSLLAEKTALKNEIMRWTARTNQLLEQYKNVDADEYRRMIEEKKQFQQQISALKTENHRSKTQLEQLKNEISKTQGELSSLKSEYQKLQDQYKKIQEQTQAAKGGYDGEIKKAKEEIEVLKKTVEEKTNDINERIKTLNQVKKIARKYKSQFDEQTTELEELKKKVEEDKKTSPVLTASEDAPPAVNESQVKELTEKIESLQSEVKRLKEADDQHKNVIKEKDEKNKKVLIQVQKKLNQYSGVKDQLTSENEALKKDIKTANDTKESLQQSITELEMRLNVLSTQYEGKLSRLENENKELKDFKENRNKKVQEEQEQKQKLVETNERLQNEIDQLQQKVQQHQLQIQQQQKKLTSFSSATAVTSTRLPATEAGERSTTQEDTSVVVTTVVPTNSTPRTAAVKPTPTPTVSSVIKPLMTPTASIRPMAISQTQMQPARTATVLPTVSSVASSVAVTFAAPHHVTTTVSVRPNSSAELSPITLPAETVQSNQEVEGEPSIPGPSQAPQETASVTQGKRPREGDDGIPESETPELERQEDAAQPVLKKIRTSEVAQAESCEAGTSLEEDRQQREDEVLEEEGEQAVEEEEMGEDYFEGDDDEEAAEEEEELDEGVSEVPDVDRKKSQVRTVPEVVLIESDDEVENVGPQEEEEEDDEEYEEYEEEEEGDMSDDYEEQQSGGDIVEVMDDEEDVDEEEEPVDEDIEGDEAEDEEEEAMEEEGEEEAEVQEAEVEEPDDDNDNGGGGVDDDNENGENAVDDNLQSDSGSVAVSQEQQSSSRVDVPDVVQTQQQGVPASGMTAVSVSGSNTQSSQQEDIPRRRVVRPGPLTSDRPRLHSAGGQLAPFSFAHGVQPSTSSQFDDLEDCTVPSTPTLFVPKRTDGFAEALSSPQIHRPFSFAAPGETGNSMTHGGGLEASISEGGLRVDDTRIDFLMEGECEESTADSQSYSVPTGIEQESEIRAVTPASHELPSQGSLESLDSEPEFATTDVSTAATVPQVSTVPAITVTPATVTSAVTEIHDDTAEQNVPVVQGSLEHEETVPVVEEETDEKGKSSSTGDSEAPTEGSEGSQETSGASQENIPSGGATGSDPSRPKGTVVQLRRPGTGTSVALPGAPAWRGQQRGSHHPHAGRARRIKRIPPGRGTSRGGGLHPRGRGAPGGRM